MIFGKDLLRKVMDGTKTVTRRPVRQGPQATRPCTYRPGRDYAVQRKRGGHEIARVQIDTLRREPLGQITFGEARAEGFKTTADFQVYWLRLHDRGWVRRQATPCTDCDGAVPQQVLQDPLGDGTATPACATCGGSGRIDADLEPALVAPRFAARHAHRVVWVITFHLLDTPRLLTPAARNPSDQDPESADAHGYTSNPAFALPHEPEAIDPDLAVRFAADAAARHAGQPGRREQQLRQRAHSLAGRLRLLAADPGVAGNVAAELHAELDQIEAHLRALEAQRRSAA